MNQGSDSQRLAPVGVAAGEPAPQRNLARYDIGCTELGEGQWGMVKPSDNSPEEGEAKGRDMASADSAHTGVEEMGIDMKADSAYCRADLGRTCRTRGEEARPYQPCLYIIFRLFITSVKFLKIK